MLNNDFDPTIFLSEVKKIPLKSTLLSSRHSRWQHWSFLTYYIYILSVLHWKLFEMLKPHLNTTIFSLLVMKLLFQCSKFFNFSQCIIYQTKLTFRCHDSSHINTKKCSSCFEASRNLTQIYWVFIFCSPNQQRRKKHCGMHTRTDYTKWKSKTRGVCARNIRETGLNSGPSGFGGSDFFLGKILVGGQPLIYFFLYFLALGHFT